MFIGKKFCECCEAAPSCARGARLGGGADHVDPGCREEAIGDTMQRGDLGENPHRKRGFPTGGSRTVASGKVISRTARARMSRPAGGSALSGRARGRRSRRLLRPVLPHRGAWSRATC